MGILATALTILAQHADLIEELVDAVKQGTPVDAIRAAIRAAKKAASEAAIREEMSQP